MYQEKSLATPLASFESDNFSSVAAKFKFLLGLNKSSKILLAGSSLIDSYYYDFKLIFDVVDIVDFQQLERLSTINNYHAIYIDYREVPTKYNLAPILKKLELSLDEKGMIVLFVNNFLSKENVKKVFKLDNPNIIKLPDFIIRSFIKRFSIVFKFSAFSGSLVPDEYSSIISNKDLRSHNIVDLFKQQYFDNFLSDTHLYILSNNSDNFFTESQKIIYEKIKFFLPECSNNLYLQKFFLRSRGALLLIYKDATQDKTYVCRVSVTDETTQVISRNKKALQNIFNLINATDYLSEKIPMYIGDFSMGSGVIFIETMKPGVLAWKFSNHTSKFSQYIKSSAQFLQAFNLKTKSNVIINDECFKSIIANDLNALGAAFETDAVTALAIKSIYSYLYKYFINKEISIVLGHGDFGPGNILCNKIDGSVTGVIDWDTHNRYELPCIDLINLEIQNLITKEKVELTESLLRLNDILSDTSKINQIESLKYYNEGLFGVKFDDFRCLLIVTVIRYIKRSLPYMDEFVTMKPEYCKALQLAYSFLDT